MKICVKINKLHVNVLKKTPDSLAWVDNVKRARQISVSAKFSYTRSIAHIHLKLEDSDLILNIYWVKLFVDV